MRASHFCKPFSPIFGQPLLEYGVLWPPSLHWLEKNVIHLGKVNEEVVILLAFNNIVNTNILHSPLKIIKSKMGTQGTSHTVKGIM